MSGVLEIFGPPPPGIDLSENKTPENNAAVIAISVVATISVILRFLTRIKIRKSMLGIDDWLIAGSIVPLIGLLVLTIEAGTFGLGKHVWVGTIEDVVGMRKVLFAYIYVYFVLMVMIKASILMFYRRILCMKLTIWVCLILCFAWAIGCAIAFTSSCWPPSYFWKMYLNPDGGKCVTNLYAYYVGNAAGNVFTDLLILSVPMPVIWGLQMRKLQKVMISSIFLLGGFVCIASIMRIYYMSFLHRDLDVNWIMGDVFVWSTVEPSIGILIMGSTLGWKSSRKATSTLRRPYPPDEGTCNSHAFQQLDEHGYSVPNQRSKLHSDEEADPIISSAHAETVTFRDEGSVGNAADPISITVKRDIQWREERL